MPVDLYRQGGDVLPGVRLPGYDERRRAHLGEYLEELLQCLVQILANLHIIKLHLEELVQCHVHILVNLHNMIKLYLKELLECLVQILANHKAIS